MGLMMKVVVGVDNVVFMWVCIGVEDFFFYVFEVFGLFVFFGGMFVD